MLRLTPWNIVRWGTWLGLLLLHMAPARAQDVERLAWNCTDQSRVGTAVTGNSCTGRERWDYGDAGNLVAACAGSCTSWQNAVWRPWSDATDQVFVCLPARAPGAWTACSNEGFVAREQVAVQAVEPPPPPTAPPPAPPINTQLAVVGRNVDVELTWPAVTLRADGSPTVGPMTYSVETVTGTVLALVTETTYVHVDPPPGRRCYRIYAIEGTVRSPYASQDGACAWVPFRLRLAANPQVVPAGGSTRITWAHNGLPSECRGSWAPASDLPQVGAIDSFPPGALQYQVVCVRDGTSHTEIDVTVAAFVAPTLDCLPFDPTKVSAVRAVQALVDGEGALRSFLGSLGLQELAVGRRVAYGWTCDLPDRNVPEWFVINFDTFSSDCARPVAGSLLSAEYWRGVWQACTRALQAGEQQQGEALAALYRWKFDVAAVAAGYRPVYLRAADGTRGARVTINGVAQSIAVGQPCDGRRRLLGTSRYHEVSGLQSTTGETLPANSFTVCTARKPPATGWP